MPTSHGRRPRLASLTPRLARIDLRTAPPAPKRADDELQTAEHRQWRATVLARAGYQCEWIKDDGIRCMRSAAHGDRMIADHVEERADGGARLDLSNGQCLCVQHNTLKGIRARAARLAAPPAGGTG